MVDKFNLFFSIFIQVYVGHVVLQIVHRHVHTVSE